MTCTCESTLRSARPSLTYVAACPPLASLWTGSGRGVESRGAGGWQRDPGAISRCPRCLADLLSEPSSRISVQPALSKGAFRSAWDGAEDAYLRCSAVFNPSSTPAPVLVCGHCPRYLRGCTNRFLPVRLPPSPLPTLPRQGCGSDDGEPLGRSVHATRAGSLPGAGCARRGGLQCRCETPSLTQTSC